MGIHADSGSIRIDENVIRHRSRVYGDWVLPITNVRIIGESTNQSGPFHDDYFICFAAGPENWHEASFYAEGLDNLLVALRARFGSSFDLHLTSSTDFASRVLWPPSLEGEPMFLYEAEPRSKFWGWIFGPASVHQTYAAPIAAYLAGTR